MAGRQLQFVVKISKYCNLRCRYCYEYADLGDRRRMATDDIAALFRHVAPALDRDDVAEIDFVWHGGEPLLVPLEVYGELADLQREVFGEAAPVRNSLQTNLTVLTPRHLDFLREGRFFTDLGVSFDVFGGQRVDIRGRERQEMIVANMRRLAEAGVPFAAIAVLCRDTLARVREIYGFYDRAGVPFRLLPIDSESFDGQAEAHAVSARETVAAMMELFEAFCASPSATPVQPLEAWLDYALAHMADRALGRYDKRRDESIFVVDLDGSLYGVADAYVEDRRYANLFAEPLEHAWASPAREQALGEAERRIERHCAPCPYFGACPGYHVGDAEPVQRRQLEEAGCPVRAVLDGLVGRLAGVEDLSPGEERAAATRA